MKKVAILTSGGDAPGMNACIRAIVLTAEHYGLEVIGYKHGYNGLIEQEYKLLAPVNVNNIGQRGGTILKSGRCVDFHTEEYGRAAAKNLLDLDIDALFVIGGNGSFRGAHHLSKYYNGQVIGLPGTIDNDISGTDATIGYYTAIETALDSIDKVRDTADAFERIFLIEVMGRHAGFIALSAAVASAADRVIVPEDCGDIEVEVDNLIEHLQAVYRVRGLSSYIVVTSENLLPGGVITLANMISEKTEIECRPVILGHVQRGGSPVSQDRILAAKLGAYAVEQAIEGHNAVMVGEHNNQLVTLPIEVSWQQQKPLDKYLLKVQRQLLNL
ncbi:ATP-dependent 6-phosphofructokinase [uncultured Paraglaciecola sp.]|uniref:6-phosphofructokinase n=1 Tax=uncultured Paraglaciecola sp. TaxID=1765024 RepID=UPI00260E336E|nr:ATP-dependent 6-phosphofructokinase [uncultured Paraglaciecola sp.]